MADLPNSPAEVIPLFPLPRTVLLPKSNLTLYIFEQRYKEMVKRCVEESLPFGVLLLRPDRQGRPEREAAYRTGGTGIVVWSRRVSASGEMVIFVRGIQRIRVLEFVEGTPYLQGRVEYPVGDWECDGEREENLRTLRRGIDRVLSYDPPSLSKLIDELGPLEDPAALADVVVGGLPLEAERKQEFLEIVDPAARVRRLALLLQDEGFRLAIMDTLRSGEEKEFAGN